MVAYLVCNNFLGIRQKVESVIQKQLGFLSLVTHFSEQIIVDKERIPLKGFCLPPPTLSIIVIPYRN